MARWIIGIDEAGRGPLAGPVAVGAVVVPKKFDFGYLDGIRDSKQLTPAAREAWYRRLRALKRAGALDFAVSFSSETIIDSRGIVPAISSALSRALARLHVAPHACEVLLDGNLRAPSEYQMQKTIIHGDESEPLIALASIAAKVERDRRMVRLAREYPLYDFEVHKGYGTVSHRQKIEAHGFCELHRVTFCRRLLLRENAV
jgi:ribonuclease HII